MAKRITLELINYWEKQEIEETLFKMIERHSKGALSAAAQHNLMYDLLALRQELSTLDWKSEAVRREKGIEGRLEDLLQLAPQEFFLRVRPVREFLFHQQWLLGIEKRVQRSCQNYAEAEATTSQVKVNILETDLKTFSTRAWAREELFYCFRVRANVEKNYFAKHRPQDCSLNEPLDEDGNERIVSIEDASDRSAHLAALLDPREILYQRTSVEMRICFEETIERMHTEFGDRQFLQAVLFLSEMRYKLPMTHYVERTNYDLWPPRVRQIIPREKGKGFDSSALSILHRGTPQKSYYQMGGTQVFYGLYSNGIARLPQPHRAIICARDLNKNQFDLPKFPTVVTALREQQLIPKGWGQEEVIACYKAGWTAILSGKGTEMTQDKTNTHPPAAQAGGNQPAGNTGSSVAQPSLYHPRMSHIWQYVTGELSLEDHQKVGIHIHTCAPCQSLYQAYAAQNEEVTLSDLLEAFKAKALRMGKYLTLPPSQQAALAREVVLQQPGRPTGRIPLLPDKRYLTIFVENEEGEVYLFRSNYYCQLCRPETGLVSIEMKPGWKPHCYLTSSFVALPADVRLEDYSHKDQALRERIIQWFFQQLEENATEWEQVEVLVSQPANK
jgi:hypothetical protein